MATIRMPRASCTTVPPKASAAPVRVSTPTIMPEPASATAMVAALKAASTSASQHLRGVIQVRAVEEGQDEGDDDGVEGGAGGRVPLGEEVDDHHERDREVAAPEHRPPRGPLAQRAPAARP